MKCPCGENVSLTSKDPNYCVECNLWIQLQLLEYEKNMNTNDKKTN